LANKTPTCVWQIEILSYSCPGVIHSALALTLSS
jgi:hypothetical protein